jgi:quinoprotein glucose dehydrogenase
MKLIAIAAASFLIAGAIVIAQTGQTRSTDNDWPMFSHDFGGTRFSPLADINADNAAKLAQAWSVQLTQRQGGAVAERRRPRARRRDAARGRGRAGGAAAAGEEGEAAGSNPEVTPIVINGVMYLPARGNQVLALDGDTGKGNLALPDAADHHDHRPRRGVLALVKRTFHPRIILSAGPRLLALDAATGQPAAGFGRNGMIEIQVPWNGVPMIYKHVAVLGTYPGEVPLGPTGDTRAFDLRTGKKLWQFQNVPLPGQVGHDTWLDYGWRDRSGTNVWAFYMTLDAERGILYMPVSAPAANYWGGDRPGANLFANSIVAVDAETGKYRWHFQTVHHDIWDFDMPAPPVLVDITQNGRRVPALASIGKSGYMFILNRVTGKPIFGVEERPVPKGDVPDEWYSPTQPFPVKPARSFGRVAFDKGSRHGAAGRHIGSARC